MIARGAAQSRPGKRKVQKKLGSETDRNSRMDFTNVLTEDITRQIFSLLPPRQLLKVALVSKQWRRLASLDQIWKEICLKQWDGKVYVPAADSDLGLSWKSRYVKAEADRKRTTLTLEELCAMPWRFRFKRTAGTWWESIDPYWLHGKDESKMMIRTFTCDGLMIAPAGDPLMDPNEGMRWRFTAKNDVQVEDFPPLVVKRRPDWGFTLENQWVVFRADLKPGGPLAHGIVALNH